MGLIITTWLDGRLWDILENGQAFPPLVRLGSRAKFSTAEGWMRQMMVKIPTSYPFLRIEVGVGGNHSAFKQDPTFATESAEALTDNAGTFDWSIARTERVRVTIESDEATITSINKVREAVIDDLMRAGPRLGSESPITDWGPITFDQRMFRLPDRRRGWQSVINFPINLQQHGRETINNQE